MWIGIISLFPQMFQLITNYGVTRRAFKTGLLSIHTWNPRDFTSDRRHTVDKRTYGGGPGMLMMTQPLRDAIYAAKKASGEDGKVIYLSPQGRKLNQKGVHELATNKKLILVCGRYEGIDERLLNTEIDEEWSIGDYVLTGGELPAMVIIDSISRCLPGILGKKESAEQDSFSNGLLDYPHYTRPEILEGIRVPSILLSGHHTNIRRWRLKQSIGATWLKRPDLLENRPLTTEQKILLSEFKNEHIADNKK
ncbi:tRNA (guanosine(37)-N1)-methyltransferase TrmD [Candidatus Erwinia haradaeae]|uniref:tRNA (guanosine(37)-N1)-methyltransferase TrmD n=1 Tax=Candidatus Erwinia haradaeae TaxID=1922217 RepID=UPI0013008DEA|nr:tRNA (guanosine(37)-N1)-methyltransferase TrmD [Candidatus Erwinia haradaeae]